MTSLQTAAALIAWVDQHIPSLATPRNAPESEWPLPDAACAITQITQAKGRAGGQVQQGVERRRRCELMLACDPEPAASAGEWLYNAVDVLMDQLTRDRTLGGRVHAAEIEGQASFEPPFIEFEEGGRARQVTLTILVRDPVVV